MEIFHVLDAELLVGGLRPRYKELFAMDLSHVNEALKLRGAEPVDVILGVDVFEAQSTVIDYATSSLFLREYSGEIRVAAAPCVSISAWRNP